MAGETDTTLPIQRTDEDYLQRHSSFLARIREGPIDLLFLGDSIMRRWEEVPRLWNACYSRYKAANFSIGGDTIQSLHWRLQDGELEHIDPLVVVLLIGTNNIPVNTGPEVADGVSAILSTIRDKLPHTKVLLMAILPRGPQRKDSIDEMNPYYMDRVTAANNELARFADGKAVRYLDIGTQFIGVDGEIDAADMPDGLHLVESGYRKWAESTKEVLADMMKSGLE